jgi:hypothetical protein
MYCGCVNSHSLLSGNVGTILKIVVLSLLFSLEPQTSKPSKILFAHCLINSGTTLDPFSVVVGYVRPPISLGFDITQDHVLHWCGQSRHLPGDICFPATPCLTKMLQDDTGFVCTDSFLLKRRKKKKKGRGRKKKKKNKKKKEKKRKKSQTMHHKRKDRSRGRGRELTGIISRMSCKTAAWSSKWN